MNGTDFIDDRDRDEQQTLDVGQDCLATADRTAEVAGSARFADDATGAPDPGEQTRATADELDGQADLAGEPAADPPEWEEVN